MATFTAIKNKKQTAGVLGGVLKYVQQEKKVRVGGLRFVTGHNCVSQSAYTEMMTTKRRFKKTDGRQFYHFVQSFAEIRLLELVDAEARLRDDVSLESFIAGFHLACGIAHELGGEPPYSFHQEEEQQISGA